MHSFDSLRSNLCIKKDFVIKKSEHICIQKMLIFLTSVVVHIIIVATINFCIKLLKIKNSTILNNPTASTRAVECTSVYVKSRVNRSTPVRVKTNHIENL